MKKLVLALLILSVPWAHSVTLKDILRGEAESRVKTYERRDHLRAVELAERVIRRVSPGLVWTIRGPEGELELKGGVLYQGRLVGFIRFDPRTLEVLSIGYRVRIYRANVDYRRAYRKLRKVVRDLDILRGARYIEPEGCWGIPVVYRGKIVFELKVREDGSRVIPYYKEEDEMRALGRSR